ncbi:hypothetical protein C8J57DRAFT_1223822 [Mycena rebaudengoi]|nr:hypothetical protein C8J57DRAFT_1223822 [Mycena rebaudengoi]
MSKLHRMAVNAGKPSNHSLKRIYNLSGRELVKVQPVATRVPVARSDSADCSGSHPALVESAPVPGCIDLLSEWNSFDDNITTGTLISATSTTLSTNQHVLYPLQIYLNVRRLQGNVNGMCFRSNEQLVNPANRAPRSTISLHPYKLLKTTVKLYVPRRCEILHRETDRYLSEYFCHLQLNVKLVLCPANDQEVVFVWRKFAAYLAKQSFYYQRGESRPSPRQANSALLARTYLSWCQGILKKAKKKANPATQADELGIIIPNAPKNKKEKQMSCVKVASTVREGPATHLKGLGCVTGSLEPLVGDGNAARM